MTNDHSMLRANGRLLYFPQARNGLSNGDQYPYTITDVKINSVITATRSNKPFIRTLSNH
jgi:hypothetical protein